MAGVIVVANFCQREAAIQVVLVAISMLGKSQWASKSEQIWTRQS